MTNSKTPKGRGRPKANNRQDIIEAVMDNYWNHGFQRFSLNEVCRRVSVSKPSMYREFGGEDGLVDAVLHHYHQMVVKQVITFIAVEQPFDVAMDHLILGMTTPQEHPPGCLFTEMRIMRKQLGTQSLARLEAIEKERQQAFERWYQRALEHNQVNPSLSSKAASHYIDAQFTLLLLDMGAGKPPAAVRSCAQLAMSVLSAQK